MRKRWKFGIGCFSIVVIVMAYRILSVYEFRSGECQAVAALQFAPTYPQSLRVMTWNIQGHAALLRTDHIEKVAETIKALKPDVVAINEAHRKTWQSRFRDHVTELQRRTGMNVAFGESYEQMGGQFGNAILTRGEIASTAIHKLPGAGEPRTVLQSIIRINGGVIEFYVTHLAAWEKLNRITRDRQLDCLVRHVRASHHPFILAGDINAPPESPEVQEFRRDIALQMVGNVQPTHRVMNIQLDYIFADRGWQVRSAETLDMGPSDHRPVIAQLAYDEKR
jgi:endonuclease/exonuclease/phosphatase family metal-dependent hydrolase